MISPAVSAPRAATRIAVPERIATASAELVSPREIPTNVTMEELGGAHTHMAKSGTVHYVASGEQDALDYVRDLLGYLPPNNYAEPPRYPAPPHPDGWHRVAAPGGYENLEFGVNTMTDAYGISADVLPSPVAMSRSAPRRRYPGSPGRG